MIKCQYCHNYYIGLISMIYLFPLHKRLFIKYYKVEELVETFRDGWCHISSWLCYKWRKNSFSGIVFRNLEEMFPWYNVHSNVFNHAVTYCPHLKIWDIVFVKLRFCRGKLNYKVVSQMSEKCVQLTLMKRPSRKIKHFNIIYIHFYLLWLILFYFEIFQTLR